MHEFIGMGYCRTYEPGDANSLACVIRSLIGAPASLDEMGMAALRTAEGPFCANNMWATIADVIHGVL
jgi:hypothetical protein